MKTYKWMFAVGAAALLLLTGPVKASEQLALSDDQPAILASLTPSDSFVLVEQELIDVRGEKWTAGFYFNVAANYSVPGASGGLSGGWKYTIARNGQRLAVVPLHLSTATVMNGSPLLGVANRNEQVLFTLGGSFYFKVGGELGLEVGKVLTQRNTYYAEFLAGIGLGTPGGSITINGVSIVPGASASATIGAWARSTGTSSQITGDILSLGLKVPVTAMTRIGGLK